MDEVQKARWSETARLNRTVICFFKNKKSNFRTVTPPTVLSYFELTRLGMTYRDLSQHWLQLSSCSQIATRSFF